MTSKRPDLLKTLSGKNFQDITLENVASGEIGAQEIRIRAETLELQAKIAEAHGRPQMALNFRRAARAMQAIFREFGFPSIHKEEIEAATYAHWSEDMP